ncbi:MAG: hypothetical protein ACRDRH_30115 [Pseudonocardia sp.]
MIAYPSHPRRPPSLSAHVPDLHAALRRGHDEDWTHLGIDGKVVDTDRSPGWFLMEHFGDLPGASPGEADAGSTVAVVVGPAGDASSNDGISDTGTRR